MSTHSTLYPAGPASRPLPLPPYNHVPVQPIQFLNSRPESSHSTASVPSLSHGPSPLPEEVGEIDHEVMLVSASVLRGGVAEEPPGTYPYLGTRADSPKDLEIDEIGAEVEGRNEP